MIGEERIDTFDEFQYVACGTSSMNINHPVYGKSAGPDLGSADTRVVDGPALPSSVRFAQLDHAISGIASEAGELAEHLKHVRFHGKALDIEYVIKELGDLTWYVAEACSAIGYSMAHIAWRNFKKLKARYPEGHFSVERSENRTPENE